MLFGRGRWRQALNALLADREVDPFRIWIEGLPAWDESPRLDTWIRECFDVEPSVSAALCSVGGSVGLPRRRMANVPSRHEARHHGGTGRATGSRKVNGLRVDVPAVRGGALWFSDGLNLNSSDKVKVEGLQGRVLVESSEMTGATRAELDRLKAFLSRVEDGTVRLAYRANPEPLPRRAVIVGSTNQFDCLPNDPSGNRRFVPIGITAGDAARVRSWFDDNRLQLWAEALHRYRAEEEAHLPDGLAEIQATATERHRAADDVVEKPRGRVARKGRDRPARALQARGCSGGCWAGRPPESSVERSGRTAPQCAEAPWLRAGTQAPGRRQESDEVLLLADYRVNRRFGEGMGGVSWRAAVPPVPAHLTTSSAAGQAPAISAG